MERAGGALEQGGEVEQAWMEQGEESGLHIIIIDEIDAICKPRGNALCELHAVKTLVYCPPFLWPPGSC